MTLGQKQKQFWIVPAKIDKNPRGSNVSVLLGATVSQSSGRMCAPQCPTGMATSLRMCSMGKRMRQGCSRRSTGCRWRRWWRGWLAQLQGTWGWPSAWWAGYTGPGSNSVPYRINCNIILSILIVLILVIVRSSSSWRWCLDHVRGLSLALLVGRPRGCPSRTETVRWYKGRLGHRGRSPLKAQAGVTMVQ